MAKAKHFHFHCVCGDQARIVALLENLMASQAELTVQVNALTEKVAKIGAETRSLLTKIDDLTQALANAGNVTPELQAAFDALAAQADVVDKLVPDSP